MVVCGSHKSVCCYLRWTERGLRPDPATLNWVRLNCRAFWSVTQLLSMLILMSGTQSKTCVWMLNFGTCLCSHMGPLEPRQLPPPQRALHSIGHSRAQAAAGVSLGPLGGPRTHSRTVQPAKGRIALLHNELQSMWSPDGCTLAFDSTHTGQGWQVR